MGYMKDLAMSGGRRGMSSASVGTAGGMSVEVHGIEEVSRMFDRLRTNDPDMDKAIKRLVRKVLSAARGRLSRDARNYMENDPRQAYKAVKYAVYKRLLGGNLSILQKQRGGRGAATSYVKPRTLKPGQRGGNRRPVGENTRTKQMESYGGSDRGFVLRFLNAGTVERMTRYGNRGSIRATDWFGHTASWQMESAVQELADNVNEYIKKVADNG